MWHIDTSLIVRTTLINSYIATSPPLGPTEGRVDYTLVLLLESCNKSKAS